MRHAAQTLAAARPYHDDGGVQPVRNNLRWTEVHRLAQVRLAGAKQDADVSERGAGVELLPGGEVNRTAICLISAWARLQASRAIDDAPDESWADIKPPSKTREQEEHYHAQINDIAKQCQHLNRQLDVATWKRLLVDQFRRDAWDDPDLRDYWRRHVLTFMPSLDGSAIVTLGEQTRNFPRKIASAFIEWLNAYGADKGVKWSDPKRPSDETLQAEFERRSVR